MGILRICAVKDGNVIIILQSALTYKLFSPALEKIMIHFCTKK